MHCDSYPFSYISEHIASVIAGMLRNCQATQRQRLLNKFIENDHEKVMISLVFGLNVNMLNSNISGSLLQVKWQTLFIHITKSTQA